MGTVDGDVRGVSTAITGEKMVLGPVFSPEATTVASGDVATEMGVVAMKLGSGGSVCDVASSVGFGGLVWVVISKVGGVRE